MDQKLVEKAKEAKSAKELAIMAREEGIELSDAEADRYYANLHSKEGELSDEELDNVAGGACDESESEKKSKYVRIYPPTLAVSMSGLIRFTPELARPSSCRLGAIAAIAIIRSPAMSIRLREPLTSIVIARFRPNRDFLVF
jgi:hypothetical protein